MQGHRHDGTNDGGVVSPKGMMHSSGFRGLYLDSTDRAYYGRYEGRVVFSRETSGHLKAALERRHRQATRVMQVTVGVLVVLALILVVVS